MLLFTTLFLIYYYLFIFFFIYSFVFVFVFAFNPLLLLFILRCSRHYGGGRQYGDRRAQFDDVGSYYRDARESMYNESSFVFVDPHVLGKDDVFFF